MISNKTRYTTQNYIYYRNQKTHTVVIRPRCALCQADTFWTNPQYRVTVIDADEGDADNNGTLIVALLQKERRLKRTEGCELLTMGYAIYKVGYRPTALCHQLL